MPAPRSSNLRRLAAVCLGPMLATLLAANLVAKPNKPKRDPDENFGRQFIDTIMNTELPFTGGDSALSLDIKPKIKDMVSEPFIRLPLELRYGFTNNREGSLGYTPYLENPFDGNGISSRGYLDFGIKQRFKEFFTDRWEFAFGVNATIPLETVPSFRLRDSFDSYKPFIVTSYQLTDDDHWEIFANVLYNLVGTDRRSYKAHAQNPRYPFDNFDPSIENPNSLLVLRPGVIYKPEGSEIRYSLEIEYKTDRYDGSDDDGLTVIPSIGWFPRPQSGILKRVPGQGSFTLSVGYVFSRLYEDRFDSDIQVDLRVRWRLRPKAEE